MVRGAMDRTLLSRDDFSGRITEGARRQALPESESAAREVRLFERSVSGKIPANSEVCEMLCRRLI